MDEFGVHQHLDTRTANVSKEARYHGVVATTRDINIGQQKEGGQEQRTINEPGGNNNPAGNRQGKHFYIMPGARGTCDENSSCNVQR